MCSEATTDLKIRGLHIVGQIMRVQLQINGLDIKALKLHAEECRLDDSDDAVAFARNQLKMANNTAHIARYHVRLAELNEELTAIGQQLMEQMRTEFSEHGFDEQSDGFGGLLANLLRMSAGGPRLDDFVGASAPRVGMYL